MLVAKLSWPPAATVKKAATLTQVNDSSVGLKTRERPNAGSSVVMYRTTRIATKLMISGPTNRTKYRSASKPRDASRTLTAPKTTATGPSPNLCPVRASMSTVIPKAAPRACAPNQYAAVMNRNIDVRPRAPHSPNVARMAT